MKLRTFWAVEEARAEGAPPPKSATAMKTWLEHGLYCNTMFAQVAFYITCSVWIEPDQTVWSNVIY